ncbi:MAG: DinB family protein [Flavobacteriaceae bacterium]
MEWSFDITKKNRAIFSNFLSVFSLEQLNTVPKGFKNSIYWNIAHVVVTQQLLVYHLSQLPMLVSDQFVEKFRKGTQTEFDATKENVDQLKKLLFSTLEQTKLDFDNGLFKSYQPYTVSTKSTLKTVEEAIEFNNFHEGIHLGYILAMKNTFQIQ